jgi:hypothetical protein
LFALFEIIRSLIFGSKIKETVATFKSEPWPMTRDFILTAIGLIGMQVFLTWGSMYTIMSHANLFSSVCAIVIVLYRLVSCQRITIPEIVGSLIAVIGCFFTSYDSGALKVDPNVQNIDFGNFLSFLSALFAVIYITKG